MSQLIKNKFYLLFIFFFFIGGMNCKNSDKLAIQGLDFLQEGKKISALRYFDEALDINPNNPYALYGKGKILLESTITFSLGQSMIERSLDHLNPKYKVDAYRSLASSYAFSNLYKKAINTLKQANEKGFQSIEIISDIVQYYISVKDYQTARTILNENLSKYSKENKIYIDLALLEANQFQNLEKAKSILEKSAEINVPTPELYKKLAIICYRLKLRNEAIDYLKKMQVMQNDADLIKQIDEWIGLIEKKSWQITL